MNRVEDELVASICVPAILLALLAIANSCMHVLLPAIKFIENGQRHAFFETPAVVAGKANNISGNLQAKRDIEVLRHVALGPETNVAIFFGRITNRLNSFPAQEGIVTDERRDLTTTGGEPDRGVYEIGKVSNAVLKVVPGDLHNTSGVLNNGNFGREVHLGSAVNEAILGNDGVRVDNEDEFTHTDVSSRSGAWISVQYGLQGLLCGYKVSEGAPCGRFETSYLVECVLLFFAQHNFTLLASVIN